MFQRSFDRTTRDLRPVTIEPGYIKNAEGSALISMGDTRVICTASVEPRVPGMLARLEELGRALGPGRN